jgi:hypothetical protein
MPSIIKTYSGNFIDLLNLDVSKITLKDIVQGCSQTCRYGGQCNKFYSTAEHTCLVVGLAKCANKSTAILQLCMGHDISEGIGMGDMVRPLKQVVAEYRNIEDVNLTRMLRAFRIKETDKLWKTVKVYDHAAYMIERQLLFDDIPVKDRQEAVSLFKSAAHWKFALSPKAAKTLFLKTWHNLNIAKTPK